MSLLGPVAALYSPMIDVCAKIKRAAACFISQVYHQCKQIVYNFYAISFLHFWTVRKCNSIPLFSQKYVFFWSHHHKYFLSERLRLNTFYEYCKDLKPKLFYFPVHFKEQTLDHFSDKLTLKGFWQVWLRDNVLYKWAKMMLIIREDNRDNPTILNKNTVQQPIGEIIKTKPFEKPVSLS